MSARLSSNPITFAAAVFFATTTAVLGGILALRRHADDEAVLRAAAELHEPRPVQTRGGLTGEEQSTIDLFRRASPSVVFVTSHDEEARSLTLDASESPRGSGSGILWNELGYVVTNDHVTEGGRQVFVTLADGSRWEAKLIGLREDLDLAVLRIDAPVERLTPITIGTSRDLQVGQRVLAIGNPFGLDQTLTIGVISGLERQIRSWTGSVIQGAIQTDAAINPGNSGGPLLDSAGRLIGINTAIHNASMTNAGVGFALPVDTVNRLVPRIIRDGFRPWPALGVVFAPDRMSRQFTDRGMVIVEVEEDGPASRAGVRSLQLVRTGAVLGDVVVGIDGHEIESREEVDEILFDKFVGEVVTLDLLRDGRVYKVRVELDAER